MKTAKLLFGLGLLLLVFACKRDDPEFEGPSLDNIYGDFSVLQDFDISNRNVDFANGETTVFTALFSKQVEWEVQITGLESGARKVITDISNELTTANARWSGTTTDVPLFKDEQCAVELIVAAEGFSIQDTMAVLSTRAIEGFLLTDFESGFNSDWITFVQSGADMSFVITDDIPAAEGNSYYDMGGEVNWDYVYFNVMLNVPEGINNEIVLFQFREDDNQDGSFSEGSEDMWALELTGLESGWQLISVRYADLVSLNNGAPAPATGDGVYSPDRLNKVSILFLADPDTGYSQTLMDYLIFTEGGPLVP